MGASKLLFPVPDAGILAYEYALSPRVVLAVLHVISPQNGRLKVCHLGARQSRPPAWAREGAVSKVEELPNQQHDDEHSRPRAGVHPRPRYTGPVVISISLFAGMALPVA